MDSKETVERKIEDEKEKLTFSCKKDVILPGAIFFIISILSQLSNYLETFYPNLASRFLSVVKQYCTIENIIIFSIGLMFINSFMRRYLGRRRLNQLQEKLSGLLQQENESLERDNKILSQLGGAQALNVTFNFSSSGVTTTSSG